MREGKEDELEILMKDERTSRLPKYSNLSYFKRDLLDNLLQFAGIFENQISIQKEPLKRGKGERGREVREFDLDRCSEDECSTHLRIVTVSLMSSY